MGRYWLKGETADQPGGPSIVLYLNWHNGQRVEVDPTADANAPRDLDQSALATVSSLPFDGVFFFGRAHAFSLVSPRSTGLFGTVYLTRAGHTQALDRKHVALPYGTIVPFTGAAASWVAPYSHSDLLARTYTLAVTAH
jgi:hypothetical protein